MKNRVFKIFFSVIALSLICSYNAHSQHKYEWISASVDLDLPKKFSLKISEEARIQNISGIPLNQLLTDVELGYKINKRFDVACIYRFAQRREDNLHFYSRQRLTTEISYDNRIKRLGFSYRVRYQTLSKRYKEDYFDEIADKYLRNRIKLTYNIRKTPVEPYVAYEIYNPLNKYKSGKIDEYRISTGAKFPINKKNRLDASILFNKEFNNRNSSSLILVLGYTFKAN